MPLQADPRTEGSTPQQGSTPVFLAFRPGVATVEQGRENKQLSNYYSDDSNNSSVLYTISATLQK